MNTAIELLGSEARLRIRRQPDGVLYLDLEHGNAFKQSVGMLYGKSPSRANAPLAAILAQALPMARLLRRLSNEARAQYPAPFDLTQDWPELAQITREAEQILRAITEPETVT